MEAFWWALSLLLMALGLLGVVIPFVPGAVLILIGVGVHRVALGPEQSVGWWTIGGLIALTVISYLLEFLSGSLGAKYYGATRWGIVGGLIGAVVGIFFGPFGIILGPLVGALTGELIGGQRIRAATKSTWGTFVGGVAGLVIKLVIAVAMLTWFAIAVTWR